MARVHPGKSCLGGCSHRSAPVFRYFSAELAILWFFPDRASQNPVAGRGDPAAENIVGCDDEPELASFLASPHGQARVKAVYYLSGCNHRVYIILSEFISREALDQLVAAFEKMLDELTPYYQERMRWLTPQQRKLIEYLCRCEKPVPVKEMSRQLFMTQQTTSSQLKDLREMGYVISHKRDRESLYELGEPLMRLCIEVKENRHEPIRMIVKFLRAWYTPDRLTDELRANHQSRLARAYITAANNERSMGFEGFSGVTPDSARDWKGSTSETFASDANRAEKQAGPSALARGIEFAKADNYEKAIAEFSAVIEMEDAPAKLKARALNSIGVNYDQLGQHEQALSCFERAIPLESDEPLYHFNKVESLLWLGQWQAGWDVLEKALNLFPPEQTAEWLAIPPP